MEVLTNSDFIQHDSLDDVLRLGRINILPQYAAIFAQLRDSLEADPRVIGWSKFSRGVEHSPPQIVVLFSDRNPEMVVFGHSSIHPSTADHVSDQVVGAMTAEERLRHLETHGYWVGLAPASQWYASYAHCDVKFRLSYSEYNRSSV